MGERSVGPRSPGQKQVLFLLLVLLSILATGCAEQAPLDYLNHPEGPVAQRQDELWDIVFAVATVIFVLVEGLLVYTIIRYRQKPGRKAAQFHGNTKAEVVLTLIPALILAGIAVPTVRAIFDLAEEPAGAIPITVVGKQFWWEYEYTEHDVITANELHIPVGRPVRLRIEGTDVIHSFWIPRLGGKQDVVPGRINYLTLEASEPGEYLGQCTEFCGLSHANMRLKVFAHPMEEWLDWVADQQQPATVDLASEGAKLFFEGTCVNCHAISGTDASARSGPDLTHFGSRTTFAGALFENNRDNLRRWLADPPREKPGALMPDYGLSAQEIDALIEFLLSLE